MSGARLRQIPDGQSNVFWPERNTSIPTVYYTGTDGADNDSCLEGNDWDVNRWVAYRIPAHARHARRKRLLSGFGSAHSAGMHFVFCDGHVQLITFSDQFCHLSESRGSQRRHARGQL